MYSHRQISMVDIVCFISVLVLISNEASCDPLRSSSLKHHETNNKFELASQAEQQHQQNLNQLEQSYLRQEKLNLNEPSDEFGSFSNDIILTNFGIRN